MVSLILVAAIFLAGSGYVDRWISSAGRGRLSQYNADYLQKSFDRAFAGFLLLSGIKSSLAVIEGSEVGIGFNLEIGDIIQSIYDYVDIAWKTALASATILLLMQSLLDAITLLDHWCLVLLLILVLFVAVAQWFGPQHRRHIRFVKEMMLFILILTIALYAMLPLSISAAAFVSGRITQPLIAASQQELESIREDFSSDSLDAILFPEGNPENTSWLSELDFQSKITQAKTRLKQIGDYFKERTEAIAMWTVRFIAGYLFDCAIFPFAFFLILFVFTKSAARTVLGLHKDRRIMEDVDKLLQKYVRRRPPKTSQPSSKPS
ncbi:MAG: hypothetical protein QNI95_13630 [Desulfobacterales bacterium]|nr:hypothetical protein [Desulfobacterales bacterium]